MTPEAYCHAKRAKGTQCDAPEPGTCQECEIIAEAVKHFGAEIEIIEHPNQPKGTTISEILTPPTRACNVCQREAIKGLAFKGNPLCASCAPFPQAGEVMLEYSETEEEALDAGGNRAGEYLDSLGRTDLAALNANEWRTFLCHVLGGYSEHMREAVKNHPPF